MFCVVSDRLTLKQYPRLFGVLRGVQEYVVSFTWSFKKAVISFVCGDIDKEENHIIKSTKRHTNDTN